MEEEKTGAVILCLRKNCNDDFELDAKVLSLNNRGRRHPCRHASPVRQEPPGMPTPPGLLAMVPMRGESLLETKPFAGAITASFALGVLKQAVESLQEGILFLLHCTRVTYASFRKPRNERQLRRALHRSGDDGPRTAANPLSHDLDFVRQD